MLAVGFSVKPAWNYGALKDEEFFIVVRSQHCRQKQYFEYWDCKRIDACYTGAVLLNFCLLNVFELIVFVGYEHFSFTLCIDLFNKYVLPLQKAI
mgnify:CR=1 FL=1